MHAERDRNDDYYAKKSKKPEQYYQDYQSKQQQNPGSKSDKARYDRPYDNRQSRQGSEPRAATGNNYTHQESLKSNFANSDRSRDTRSSEPGGGGNHYEHRNKPPSGQPRIINSSFPRLPANLEHLPPRLKKKYLLEAGLSEDLVDKPFPEMTQQSYSNTLPSGRGRNHRYDQQNYHQQNYQSSYQPKYNNQNQGYHDHESNHHNHRSLTPPPSKGSRQQPKPPQPRYDWKANDIQRRDDTSPANRKTTAKDDSNFDWSEDVLNSQSLPHEVNSLPSVQGKYDENNRHRHRRRRNRR